MCHRNQGRRLPSGKSPPFECCCQSKEAEDREVSVGSMAMAGVLDESGFRGIMGRDVSLSWVKEHMGSEEVKIESKGKS